MKKILGLLLVLSSVGITFAQSGENSSGLKGGLNIATFVSDDFDVSYQTGAHFGGFVEVPFSEKVSISSELLFSVQGGEVDVEGGKIDFETIYVNIPVMFKYYISEKINIQVGPQLGLLVSSEYDENIENVETNDVETNDVGFDDETIEFGLGLGLGYFLTENIFVDARYNLGLSEVYGENVDFKNSVFQLSLGYKF